MSDFKDSDTVCFINIFHIRITGLIFGHIFEKIGFLLGIIHYLEEKKSSGGVKFKISQFQFKIIEKNPGNVNIVQKISRQLFKYLNLLARII